MSRREFPKAVMREALKRAGGLDGGKCEGCGAALTTGKFAFDHINPDAMTGEPTLANCQVLCSPCHLAKTKQDMANIAEAKRRSDKHAGIRSERVTGFRKNPPPNTASGKLIKTLPPRRPIYVPMAPADALLAARSPDGGE